jgi:hypothetical protein
MAVAAGSPEERVYTFQNVVFDVNGVEYCVSSINIILRENSIPTVRLIVDPAHVPTDPVTPATKATLEDLHASHQALQEAAENKSVANLHFEVWNVNGMKQQVSLENWVTTAAGMTGVSASGSFALEVEIQHPICKTNYAGLNLGGFITELKVSPGDLRDDNLITAVADSITKYADLKVDANIMEAECNASPASIADLIDAFGTKLRDAATALEEHLEWVVDYNNDCGYSDWPIPGCLDTQQDLIVRSVLSYVTNGLDTNVWEIMARHICPQWFVSIIPRYWEDKLVLAPFTPWGDPMILITDSEIADITFPGVDPNPIAGVFVEHLAPGAGDDYTVYLPNESSAKMNLNGMGYIPEAKPPGMLSVMSVPRWLEAAIMSQAAEDGDATSPQAAEADGDASTPANGEVDEENDVESDDEADFNHALYRGALYWCAKQTFLTLFRQDVQVNLRCALLLGTANSSVPGNWVAPGFVCQIDANGTALFDFYITDVIHTIDCQAGTAGTQISGRYARPSVTSAGTAGFPGVVEPPACNPVYVAGA